MNRHTLNSEQYKHYEKLFEYHLLLLHQRPVLAVHFDCFQLFQCVETVDYSIIHKFSISKISFELTFQTTYISCRDVAAWRRWWRTEIHSCLVRCLPLRHIHGNRAGGKIIIFWCRQLVLPSMHWRTRLRSVHPKYFVRLFRNALDHPSAP